MSQLDLQLPESPSGSDLGILRSNDNYYIPITAYDPTPQLGPVIYALTELLDGGIASCTSATYGTSLLDLGDSNTGTDITTISFGSSVSSSTWLPSDLDLDTTTGYIFGYVPTQTEYLKKYSINISATKTYTTSSVSVTTLNTFTLGILNNNPDIITWVSSNTLSIPQGMISDLSIVATHTEAQSALQYSLVEIIDTGNATVNQYTLTNMSSVVGITTGMSIVQLSTTTSVLADNSFVVSIGTSTVTLNQVTTGTIVNGKFSFTPYIGGLRLTNTGNIIGQGNTTGTFTATVVTWNPYYSVELLDGGIADIEYDYDAYGGYSYSFNGIPGRNNNIIPLDGETSDPYGLSIDNGSASNVGNLLIDGGNRLSNLGLKLDGGYASSYYAVVIVSGGSASLGYIQPKYDVDGGYSGSKYSVNDPATDGGSSISLYGSNENFLNGGSSISAFSFYNNDGGAASTVYSDNDPKAIGAGVVVIPPFDTSLTGPIYIYPFSTQSLTINILPSIPYTGIYVRPFLSIPKRKSYLEFISNTKIFPPNLLYRGDDPNFGVQKDIKMFLEFGIQSINLNDYVPALWENFNRRRLTFENIKVARAKDQAGNYLYDVIYADIIDNINGVKLVIYDKNNIYYPASIANMRHRLESIVLPNYTYISVDQYHLPKFMQTAQTGTYLPTNYIKVVPLCYVQPGKSSSIIDQIRLSGFDFKLYDFEIDRLIIQNSLDNTTDKYLLFPRNSLTTVIPQDNLIFGDDGVQIPITRA